MPVDKDELNRLLRQLPQVDAVLSQPALAQPLSTFRHAVVTRLVRDELARLRERLKRGKQAAIPQPDELAQRVANRLAELSRPLLKPTVNATGIVLHTNLGRALLSSRAQQAVADITGAYSNLELDLTTGKRTRRDVTLEPLLYALTGCPASTVVNNNSAAVFLVLNALANGREVITSRGELVEIGGSYRVPDVVMSSGCKLVEVGTTNRTRLDDYRRAITEDSALILKTHTSNYRIIGFTESTPLSDLVALGRETGVPVFVDLGSGYLAPDAGARLKEEDVQEVLDAGAELVSFSGDKLLGGPQAGIVLGAKEHIVKLRKSPLWRVLRIDKMTVAALGATLAEHLHSRAADQPEITQLNHLAVSEAEQLKLARRLKQKLALYQPTWEFEVAEGTGFYGGGSLPEEQLPARLVTVKSPHHSADRLDTILRHGDPPVVGYSAAGVFALNVLTLVPGDVERICQRIKEVGDGD
ncbi:L-seryl-tRNA(Sec) selenium transferase [bacterium]|nr:L-seryl-tRNA(Sec) selenium transferase [bacterium]